MIVDKIYVITEDVQVQAADLVTPKVYNNYSQPKYSLTILFDRKSQMNVEKTSATNAALSAFFQSNIPPVNTLKMPYQNIPNGLVMLTARNTVQPKVVDWNNKPLHPSKISIGDTVRVILKFFAYDFPNNKGVACLLGNIQKMPPNSSKSSGTGIGIFSRPTMPSSFPPITSKADDIDNDDGLDDDIADEEDDDVTYIGGKNEGQLEDDLCVEDDEEGDNDLPL